MGFMSVRRIGYLSTVKTCYFKQPIECSIVKIRLCSTITSHEKVRHIIPSFTMPQINFENRHQYNNYWKNVLNRYLRVAESSSQEMYSIKPLTLVQSYGNNYEAVIDEGEHMFYDSFNLEKSKLQFLDRTLRCIASVESFDWSDDGHFVVKCTAVKGVDIGQQKLKAHYVQFYAGVFWGKDSLNAIEMIKADATLTLNPENINKYRQNINKMEYNIDKPPDMSESQFNALQSVLNQKITIIKGPPGTGKSTTIASIVWHLVNLFNYKVLLCSSSNIANKVLVSKISRYPLKIFQLYSKSYVGKITDQPDEKHKSVATLKTFKYIGGREHFFSKIDTTDDSIVYSNDSSQVDDFCNADVICCTCAMASTRILSSMEFDCVIIDEAAQMIELEAVIPLVLTRNKIVLVGDENQLGPILRVTDMKKILQVSLFERLLNTKFPSILLEEQFRMHSALTEYVSKQFYKNKLRLNPTLRSHFKTQFETSLIDWPNKNYPIAFYSVYGQESLPPHSTSYYNLEEVEKLLVILETLLSKGISASNIGIITPYNSQRDCIIKHIHNKNDHFRSILKELEVYNVNGFQGREKDYIIISCVRSNQDYNIGFVNDVKQLNVAITRAKYGVFIVANPRMLYYSSAWKPYIEYLQSINVMIEPLAAVSAASHSALPEQL